MTISRAAAKASSEWDLAMPRRNAPDVEGEPDPSCTVWRPRSRAAVSMSRNPVRKGSTTCHDSMNCSSAHAPGAAQFRDGAGVVEDRGVVDRGQSNEREGAGMRVDDLTQRVRDTP